MELNQSDEVKNDDISNTPVPAVDHNLPMMVHVIAPSTLSAGYVFDVHIDDDPNKLFQCTVPEGGVTQGQIFLVPLPKDYSGARIMAPTGRWKDGLCDCFNAGLLHPSFWCSWCCEFIALAQIMTRMKLTILGRPGPLHQTQHTFTIIVGIWIAFWILTIVLNQFQISRIVNPVPLNFFYFTYIFMIWYIVATCQTRNTVRERYQIPEQECFEQNCPGCLEDCCCSWCCSCCTMSQMLRHTGEYERYPGVCCSTTGHPPGTPLVV